MTISGITCIQSIHQLGTILLPAPIVFSNDFVQHEVACVRSNLISISSQD